eukprot:3717459-Rhodomonas_salina.2
MSVALRSASLVHTSQWFPPLRTERSPFRVSVPQHHDVLRYAGRVSEGGSDEYYYLCYSPARETASAVPCVSAAVPVSQYQYQCGTCRGARTKRNKKTKKHPQIIELYSS